MTFEPVTLIIKLDLDIVKMYLYIKNEVQKGFKSYSLNRRTDTQTDMIENIPYPHTGGDGNAMGTSRKNKQAL